MIRSPRPGYKKIIEVERYVPDTKHDTRYLECGHSFVVPRTTLHPMTMKCKGCGK